MKAYVLIETAPGKTKSVKKELRRIAGHGSTLAHLDAVTGPYDFIAQVEGADARRHRPPRHRRDRRRSTASPAPPPASRSRSADVRVLIAGGTEFISLHLLRALLRDGHEVVVLNRGRQPGRLPAGVRTIVADRKDHARSAQGPGRRAVRRPRGRDLRADHRRRRRGAARRARRRVGHVLFVSTGRVYDHARPIPFDEDTPRTLYWGEYAKNKIAGRGRAAARATASAACR